MSPETNFEKGGEAFNIPLGPRPRYSSGGILGSLQETMLAFLGMIYFNGLMHVLLTDDRCFPSCFDDSISQVTQSWGCFPVFGIFTKRRLVREDSFGCWETYLFLSRRLATLETDMLRSADWSRKRTVLVSCEVLKIDVELFVKTEMVWKRDSLYTPVNAVQLGSAAPAAIHDQ
jgi:hypothetical protein